MKKPVKLPAALMVAAIAAPGVGWAQSSVEIYGDVHMSINSFTYSASTAGNPGVTKWDVANHASNYGLRGRENVGGGLTAWFQIEQNAPLERSNNSAVTPASRNSAIGLQGAWGNAFMGQWTTPWADLDGLWNVGTVGGWGPVTSIIGRRETTGTASNPNCQGTFNAAGLPVAVGSVAANPLTPICDAVETGGGAVGHPFWKRISNAVFYQSPVFSGTQAKVAYQTNEGRSVAGVVQSNILGAPGVPPTSVESNSSVWSTSIQWSGMGGRARIGAAYDRHRDFTRIGATDIGWAIKGGYNFGVVDVGAAFERMSYKHAAGDCEATQWGVAGSFPIAAGAVKGSYAVAKDMSGGAQCVGAFGTGTDSGAKMWNLGYEHNFSKRTNIGVGYARINNDPNAAFTWTGAPPNQGGALNVPLAGSDPSTVFLSMRHRF